MGEGEKLICVRAVGICGSDSHWFAEGGIGDVQLEHPLVLSHEFAGIAESGQLVAVDPAIPCGKCEFCKYSHPICAWMSVLLGMAASMAHCANIWHGMRNAYS